MKRWLLLLLIALALPALACGQQQPTPRYYHQHTYIEAYDQSTVYVFPSVADTVNQDIAASGTQAGGDDWIAFAAVSMFMMAVLVLMALGRVLLRTDL